MDLTNHSDKRVENYQEILNYLREPPRPFRLDITGKQSCYMLRPVSDCLGMEIAFHEYGKQVEIRLVEMRDKLGLNSRDMNVIEWVTISLDTESPKDAANKIMDEAQNMLAEYLFHHVGIPDLKLAYALAGDQLMGNNSLNVLDGAMQLVIRDNAVSDAKDMVECYTDFPCLIDSSLSVQG